MIAILAAMREEVADYLSHGGFRASDRTSVAEFYRSSSPREVLVVLSGVGRARVEDALRRTLENFTVDLVIATGFAGGVRPALQTGELVLSDRVMTVDGPPESWPTQTIRSRPAGAATWRASVIAGIEEAGLRPSYADCLTVPQLASTSAMKTWIGSNFPVGIVDMESYWVCRMAAGHGVSHLVARAVLDPVKHSLPTFVSQVAATGRPGLLRTLTYALSRPSEIPGLIRLAEQAKAASASLDILLNTIVNHALEPREVPLGSAGAR